MDTISVLIVILVSMVIGYLLSNLRRRKKHSALIPSKSYPPLSTEELPSKEEESLEKKLMLEESIEIIQKLTQAISSSFSLDDLAHEIVRTTAQILNVEICTLLLLDEKGEKLSMAAGVGIDQDLINTTTILNGEEISGTATKFNETIIINDLEKKRSLYNLKYDVCYKNSLISMPLSIKNKTIGTMNLSSRKIGKPFSPVDITLIRIIALESAIAIQNLKLLEEQQKSYLNTIIALASAVDARDPYTYRHSNNVTKYSVRMAKEMKLPYRAIENIRQAGLLHDIGKIGISDAILSKNGKLTDEEYLQIKTHPAKGEGIIKSLPFLNEIAKIIRHHHEKFDGKGYPDSIGSEIIEFGARILAVADSFDAMTTDRPYRKALTLEEAKNELLKNKNTQFDPRIVECFLQILEKEPTLICDSDIRS